MAIITNGFPHTLRNSNNFSELYSSFTLVVSSVMLAYNWQNILGFKDRKKCKIQITYQHLYII